MSRLVLALLAGMFFLAQAAAADQRKGEPGRYQVIPGAAVPGKGGKVSQKPILLDTATGQTWVLSSSPGFGGLPGPLWEPLRMKPIEPVKAAAKVPSKVKTKTAVSRKAATPAKPAKRPPGPFDRYDYDDNP